MFRRPHYIAVALVALLTLLVLNLPGSVTSRLKIAIASIFLPLFGLATGAQQTADKAGDAVLPRGEILRQNETLRRENQQLAVKANQANELTRENDRLRQLLDLKRRSAAKLRLANVVLRDPANWWRTVQIDLGSRHGLSNNLPVLSPEGTLVGRVASVNLAQSQVVLVGDPACSVPAFVENAARDMGIIGASGPLDNSFVELGYLSRSADIKPGQNVFSSGLGGIFPKGILIGKVVDARPVEYGLRTEARVKLAANLGSLEELWVMFP